MMMVSFPSFGTGMLGGCDYGDDDGDADYV